MVPTSPQKEGKKEGKGRKGGREREKEEENFFTSTRFTSNFLTALGTRGTSSEQLLADFCLQILVCESRGVALDQLLGESR